LFFVTNCDRTFNYRVTKVYCMPQFTCPKCGAGLEVKTGTHIATCQYCQTTTYIDRSTALFFYLVPFTIDETKAKGIFKRWSAGPSMAKELEYNAVITKFAKEYFPVFQFRRLVKEKEQIVVKPAKGTTLPGMQNLVIPPGSLTIFDTATATDGAEVLKPDLSIDSYFEDLPGKAVNQSIVYFPAYEVTYTFKGETYELVIDGSSGDVYTGPFPGRSSGSYLSVMGLAAALGLFGGLLGILVNPVFFVLAIAGFFAGNILGTKLVQKSMESTK